MPGTIVFFGRNPSIMALVKNQMIAAGYTVEGFLEDDHLMKRLAAGGVSLLVLGGGVEDGPRETLRTYCSTNGIKLLEHFGGPDQLLQNVRAALG